MENTELEEINLAIAKIAGWTDISPWNLQRQKQVFVGSNLAHPELGIFIPDYVTDLNAIVLVFHQLNIFYRVAWRTTFQNALAIDINEREAIADTEAIALCKLLLVINPTAIAPKPAMFEATFG